MKIISWNVNGIRAVARKNFFADLKIMNPDIICIQETRAQDNQVYETLSSVTGYYIFSNSAKKKGHSGTAILSRNMPLSVLRNTGIAERYKKGRILCAEYPDFYLVNIYVPNSGGDFKKLLYRKKWDLALFKYLKKLEKKKPVIVCGDFNVAHESVDLANPEESYNKFAGYSQEEIDGMNRYTDNRFIDSFRHFYPEKTGAYSWWSYLTKAREKNIGWRIDYFLISQAFMPSVKDAFILPEIMGSDHCPVGIELI